MFRLRTSLGTIAYRLCVHQGPDGCQHKEKPWQTRDYRSLEAQCEHSLARPPCITRVRSYTNDIERLLLCKAIGFDQLPIARAPCARVKPKCRSSAVKVGDLRLKIDKYV